MKRRAKHMNKQLDLFDYEPELLRQPVKYVDRCKARSENSSLKAIKFINKNRGQAVHYKSATTHGTRPEGLSQEDKKNYDKW